MLPVAALTAAFITPLPRATQSCHGSVCHDLFAKVGAALSEKKRACMAPQGEFLGLEHDLGHTVTDGTVKFWPRAGLVENEVMESLYSYSLDGDNKCICGTIYCMR